MADRAGPVVGIVTVMVDEASWQAVLAAVPAWVYVEDREGRVRAASRGLSTALGSDGDLRGRPAASVLAGDEAEREAVRAALREGFAGPIAPIPAQLRLPDGGALMVELAVDSAELVGEPVLVVAVHELHPRRATGLRRSAEERERVGERLRALGELAAGVAHNFNNSLTSILAHAQVLARSPELPGWAREDLEVIERVAREAAVTVRRIQSFARSRDPDAVEPTDLADVVANAIALTRPRWNASDSHARWTLDWTPSPVPLPIVGNGAALCEVIVDLILNALDAMPDGGALSIASGRAGAQVWVEVRDEGVGIDEASRAKLFDPFFSTSKGRQGVGLGLSVGHQVIARHGGEIRVDSEPGRGSAFFIQLPLAGAEPGAAGEGGEHGEEGAPARSATLLLVDDDPTVRRSVAQLLEELGHRVVPAGDGREALRVLDERHADIDLFVTDLAMPGLDGAGLLREVSRRYPSLPRVLITGLAADAEPGANHVADAILAKPLELSILEQTLANLLARAARTG